jgi:imidazole glycerol-phosphate synthase subunit HisF
MLTRRIIPCLDVLGGRVVKGKRFRNLVDVGNPVELAARYSDERADEIVLLDISASLEERKPFFDIVMQVAKRVAIPLTVGGGIRGLDDIINLLHCGADKVSLNTILAEDPALLDRAAERVGSQALVGAIDVHRQNGGWSVRVKSGTQQTDLDAIHYAKTLVEHGAGELLVTSIDMDGMKAGYDLQLLQRLARTVNVPLVASGGAGSKEHIADALNIGEADAVLAASIFHYNQISIGELKRYLHSQGIPVRL